MSDLATILGALPRIHDALRTRGYRDAATDVELSEHQVRILANLDDRDPSMVGELAEHMRVTPSTMSLNLKRLERDGFVSRSRDPADRRVINVRLTEAGRRARDSVALVDPDRVEVVLGLLRPDERRRALDGLAVLAEGVDRLLALGGEHVAALTGSKRPEEGG